MGETYYEVLGVDPDATTDEIESAYRERVLETHPDHNDAPDAAEQFKRVSTAESVLTNGTERARYDRLGHDAYVGLAQRTADSSESDANRDDSGGNASDTDNSSSDATADSSTGGNADSSSRSTRGSRSNRTRNRSSSETASGAERSRSRTGSDRGRNRRASDRTSSHHDRHRKRRQRRKARDRATSGWSFGGESDRKQSTTGPSATGTSTSASATATTHRAGTTPGTSATATGDADDASAFRYAVHDWDDDVDLEWEGEPLEYSTAVTFGCLWLLYPVFVAASLTASFPLVINAIVAACTFALVGYVLTKPRVAAAMFGTWSMLFPIGIDQLAAVSQFSIVGLAVLGFAWIPFGYAIVLWWALRP